MAAVSRHAVSAFVITCNRVASLERVLVALERQTFTPLEIIVVDNDSTDGTLGMLATKFPHLRVLAGQGNRGFARSVNAAALVAKGDIFLFLADDIIAEPTYVEELVHALDTACAAIVGGVLREWPDASRLNYAGATVSRSYRLRVNRSRVPTGDDPVEVGFVPGNDLAVRRDVFESLGGLDRAYETVYEDLDLCVRARRAGHRLALAPRAHAAHITHPPVTSFYHEYYGRRNVWIFYAKHAQDPFVLAAFVAYLTFFALPRDVARALARRDRELLRATWRGYAYGWTHARQLASMRRLARASATTARASAK